MTCARFSTVSHAEQVSSVDAGARLYCSYNRAAFVPILDHRSCRLDSTYTDRQTDRQTTDWPLSDCQSFCICIESGEKIHMYLDRFNHFYSVRMVLFVAVYCTSGTNSSDFLQCFAYSCGERTGSCEVLLHRRGAVLHIRQPVLRWNTPVIDIMSDRDIRSADLHYKGTVPAKLCVCGRMWLDVLDVLVMRSSVHTLRCCFELGPIGYDRRSRGDWTSFVCESSGTMVAEFQ